MGQWWVGRVDELEALGKAVLAMVSGRLSWYVSNIENKVVFGRLHRMASKSCLMTSTDTLMVQTSGSSGSHSTNCGSKTVNVLCGCTLPNGRGADWMPFPRPRSKSMSAMIPCRLSTVTS